MGEPYRKGMIEMSREKVLIAALDLPRGKAYFLDLEGLSYRVVDNSSVADTRGYGVEIYLPSERRNALVAMLSIDDGCYLFCINGIYDLLDLGLSASVKSLLFYKMFTLKINGLLQLQFRYRCSNEQSDILSDISKRLMDPLRELYFRQMVGFFSARTIAERSEIDKANNIRLRAARILLRRGMNLFHKMKDIYTYGF